MKEKIMSTTNTATSVDTKPADQNNPDISLKQQNTTIQHIFQQAHNNNCDIVQTGTNKFQIISRRP